MTITDETLSAYLDGELPTSEMDRITDAVAASPELAARLEALSASNALLGEQFAALDKMPIRRDTMDLIEQFGAADDAGAEKSDDTLVSFPARGRFAAVRQSFSWGQAIAASLLLAVGVVTGIQLGSDNGSAPGYGQLQTAGLIEPASPLHRVLESSPSMETTPLNGADVMPVMTFAATDGGFCREFQMTSSSVQSRNVACRTSGGWLVKASIAITAAEQGTGDSFVPAGVEAGLIDQTIMGLIAGDALNSTDEKALIDGRWQR